MPLFKAEPLDWMHVVHVGVSVAKSWQEHATMERCTSLMHVLFLSQAAAKDAARDAGMSDSDNEEEGGEIRLVKAGEQAAREAAAATAAYNAALAAVCTFQGLPSPALLSSVDGALGFAFCHASCVSCYVFVVHCRLLDCVWD